MVSNRCPLFPLGLLLALAVVVSGLGCPKATPPNPPNQGGMKVVPLDDATPVNAGPPAQGVPPDPVAQANPGPRTPDGSKGAGAADADADPTGRTLNYTGDFETIRLGLVAGVPVYHTLNTTSKIYSVKVGLLKGAANPAGPVAAAAGIREDFRKAKVGGLPDGWSLSPAAILTVQKSGERPALEINGMGPGTDAVTLPAVSLKGDFFCDCEFEIASKDALVIVQFEGAARNVVLLQVKGDGKMSMQNRFPGDAGKAWNATPKTNLLRLERKGGAYRVKINDQDVGSLPDTVAPGELTAVKLGMSLKNKDDKTPRIYSVRVVPLDEPAKPE